MTADRLFAPPAEDASVASAKQAQDFLALAMTPEHLSTWGNSINGHLDYEHGFEALRDALVGNAHATLAANDTLGRIAAALEMVAKTLAAVDLLASHVTATGALLHAALRDTRAEVVELRSSVETGGEPIADAIRAVAAAVDTLSQAVEPQPRWWQFGLRRRQQPAVDVTASQEEPWEVQPDGH